MRAGRLLGWGTSNRSQVEPSVSLRRGKVRLYFFAKSHCFEMESMETPTARTLASDSFCAEASSALHCLIHPGVSASG